MVKKKKISQEDIDTWENFVKNPTDIIDKDKNINKQKFNNSRYKYDLHGYSLDEANKKVGEIILFCVNMNLKEILFITGKGIHSNVEKNIYASKDLSKLKFSVPEYIKSNEVIAQHVLSISAADKKDGGEGAIIIELKKL